MVFLNDVCGLVLAFVVLYAAAFAAPFVTKYMAAKKIPRSSSLRTISLLTHSNSRKLGRIDQWHPTALSLPRCFALSHVFASLTSMSTYLRLILAAFLCY